ncbi:MAG: hypothetical protein JXO22_03495 [Phycisphaerae bacterium]|nr:hypothetical protein [Phycisphaerae bacterium]
MSTDWRMPSRSNTCSACGREFEIDETFSVALFETREGYERRDTCLNCTPVELDEAVARWRTRRPSPRQPRQTFDREAIYTFFCRLTPEDDTATPDPARLQFRFVLALLLWRKKVLRLDESVVEDGREHWLFAAPHADANFRVERPEFDDEQLEQLSRQLEQFLAEPPADLNIVPAGPPGAEEERRDE